MQSSYSYSYTPDAVEIVSRAIAADNNDEYERALSLYRDALTRFTIGLKHEENDAKKRLLIERVDGYMKRAEDLRDYLDKKAELENNGDSSGNKPGRSNGTYQSYAKQGSRPTRPPPKGKSEKKTRIETPSLELGCGVCEDGLLPAERRTRCQDLLEREKKLLVAILALVVVMNVPLGRYLLYPFLLFSTRVHEMCHGIAAVLMGGGVSRIMIYADGSGVAYTSLRGKFAYGARRVVVASAGYTGTALAGFALLLIRRTRRGPRRAVFGIAVVILLSAVLFIRNAFGFVAMALIGASLALCGWLLDAGPVAYLHSFLAATCCLNAVTSIRHILSDRDCVSGENAANDAKTVAEYTGVPYWFWAGLWLALALGMCAVGLIFAAEPSAGLPSAPYAERNKDSALCG